VDEHKELLILAIAAALKAGEAIREIYRRDYAVTTKADNSPLTEADRRSHAIIVRRLEASGIPILSEEGREIAFGERSAWERLWIVDPLDGTKEFIKRNGEFTVNIALVAAGRTELGVVLAPEKERLYFGGRGLGAFRAAPAATAQLLKKERGPSTGRLWKKLCAAGDALPIPSVRPDRYTIVGSRSHATPELKAFVDAKRREHGRVDFISAGSSLKICLVAEGAAHIYPRLGPTMEWDTAAGQGVVEAAGGRLIDCRSLEPLQYNRADLLNPWFYVLGPAGHVFPNTMS